MAYPEWEEELTKEDVATVVFQVNGKTRGKEDVTVGLSKEVLKEKALTHERIKKYTEGKEIVKIIVVPNKLVNIVVK